MAARDKREDSGERSGDPTEREPSPLDHHRGRREELTPLVRGDDSKPDDSSAERD